MIKKRILAAVTAAVVLSGTIATAWAVGTKRTIEIDEGIDVFMNGEKITMTDAQGNPVEAFVYNGTTYLPARAISEANGNEIAWDGEIGRVDITSNASDNSDPTAAKVAAEEDKYLIFEVSDNVTRTTVTYRNRYGIEIAADLYKAKDLDETKQYPAIVVGPPYGGVKEQGPGVYANELAQRGFVVLTFDPSYNGESGGEPRHLASSDIFAEDFSAGVDFLGTLNYVDREKIGAIGICASGGFVLGAAAIDARIKAVVTSAMYDIPGFGNSMDNDAWQSTISSLAKQRWQDVDNGYPGYTPMYESDKVYDEVPEGITGNNAEFFSFYGLKRGHHPNSTGGATNTSEFSLSNFPVTYHIDKVSPRPILFITGDVAHSRAFSETAYAAANEPKELYVVPGAMHIDLYDDVTKIPFDKIETFFKEALNK